VGTICAVCTLLYNVHVLTIRRAASSIFSPFPVLHGIILVRHKETFPALQRASIIDRSSRAGLLQLPNLEAEEEDDGSAIQ
jgi:hypothetical protein